MEEILSISICRAGGLKIPMIFLQAFFTNLDSNQGYVTTFLHVYEVPGL